MSASTSIAGEACERFFAIDELVTTFLHQAPTRVLVNCQAVCKLWNSIICDMNFLQDRLFFIPISLRNGEHRSGNPPGDRYGDDGSRSWDQQAVDGPAERITAPISLMPSTDFVMNPILSECFGPIFAPCAPGRSFWSSYLQLRTLPWAKDGTQLDASSREAYAREEASWRQMLVSQPPIYRLDWWHEWTTADGKWGGWGHQDFGGEGGAKQPVTLGQLWDLVEARLRRQCLAKILYFPKGQAPEADVTAGDAEKEWARDPTSQHRGFTSNVPRVKIMTKQVWDRLPKPFERYNMRMRRWEEVKREEGDRSRGYAGDGFNALRSDCRREGMEGCWSRSDRLQWTEINGESSAGPMQLLSENAYTEEELIVAYQLGEWADVVNADDGHIDEEGESAGDDGLSPNDHSSEGDTPV